MWTMHWSMGRDLWLLRSSMVTCFFFLDNCSWPHKSIHISKELQATNVFHSIQWGYEVDSSTHRFSQIENDPAGTVFQPCARVTTRLLSRSSMWNRTKKGCKRHEWPPLLIAFWPIFPSFCKCCSPFSTLKPLWFHVQICFWLGRLYCLTWSSFSFFFSPLLAFITYTSSQQRRPTNCNNTLVNSFKSWEDPNDIWWWLYLGGCSSRPCLRQTDPF